MAAALALTQVVRGVCLRCVRIRAKHHAGRHGPALSGCTDSSASTGRSRRTADQRPGALRAISAGRGATRQLLCSVCTAGAHRRAAPQRGSASGSSSTLLGQVRRGRVRHSAPSQRTVCAVCGVTRPAQQRLSRKCGLWTQTVTSSRHSRGHSESHRQHDESGY